MALSEVITELSQPKPAHSVTIFFSCLQSLGISRPTGRKSSRVFGWSSVSAGESSVFPSWDHLQAPTVEHSQPVSKYLCSLCPRNLSPQHLHYSRTVGLLTRFYAQDETLHQGFCSAATIFLLSSCQRIILHKVRNTTLNPWQGPHRVELWLEATCEWWRWWLCWWWGRTRTTSF